MNFFKKKKKKRALLTNGTEGGQSSWQLPNISVVSLRGEGSRKFLCNYFHILEHPACLATGVPREEVTEPAQCWQSVSGVGAGFCFLGKQEAYKRPT